MILELQYLLFFMLYHFQEQGENDWLPIQQEDVEYLRCYVLRAVIDEDGLKNRRENRYQTDLYLIHNVIVYIWPCSFKDAFQKAQQIHQFGGLHVKAFPPLVVFHYVYETEECVFLVIKMLQHEGNDKVHSLAVRNLRVIHRIGMKHVKEKIITWLRIDFELRFAKHGPLKIFGYLVVNVFIFLFSEVLI